MDVNAEYNTLVAIPRARRTADQNARVRDLAAILVPQPAPRPVSRKRADYSIRTITQAQRALRRAERAVAEDQGEEAVDAAWGDIVRSVLWDVYPPVAAEILRMEGIDR